MHMSYALSDCAFVQTTSNNAYCLLLTLCYRHLPQFGSVVLAPELLCSSSNPTASDSDKAGNSSSSSTKVPPALWCAWKLISPVDAALRRKVSIYIVHMHVYTCTQCLQWQNLVRAMYSYATMMSLCM